MVSRGKGSVSRTVLVPEILQVCIDCYQAEHRLGAKPGSYVLAAENRSKMGYDSLLHRIKRIGANAGLGRVTPHALRHCYAIALYSIAGDIRFVQDQLGHSSVTTTSIYARTKPTEGRRQVESLHIFGGLYPKGTDIVDKPDVLKKLGLQDV